MKLEINIEKLKNSLMIVERALPSKTVIESLKGIKITAKNNKVTFYTSKQDMAIAYSIEEDFTILKEGSVILPGTYLINIIKKTVSENILLDSNGKTTLLKSNSSKIDLVEYDISSYPEISFDNINEIARFELDKSTLEKAFTQTHNSASLLTTTPIISGINFNFKDDVLTAASTDARRLAISKFNINNQGNFNFTITTHILNDVIKVLNELNIENTEFVITKNQMIIITDTLKMKVRLLEGEYPDIERLVPTNVNYSFLIDGMDLKVVLEKIKLLSERDNASVKAKIEDNKFILESQFRELGAIEERCDIELINGTPFVISFDPNFLLDAINSIGPKMIEIKMVDEVSAFMINEQGNEENRHIISPFRTA